MLPAEQIRCTRCNRAIPEFLVHPSLKINSVKKISLVNTNFLRFPFLDPFKHLSITDQQLNQITTFIKFDKCKFQKHFSQRTLCKN